MDSGTPQSKVQKDAVEKTLAVLAVHDRTRIVMACGTGKTFTQLKAAEALVLQLPCGPKRIVIQVPTLDLVRQTYLEWAEQQDLGDRYDAVCICSDPSLKSNLLVADGADDIVLTDCELAQIGLTPDMNATRDVERLNNWLNARETANANAVSVVVTTYNSVKVLGMAMAVRNSGDRHFAIGIFDEAHKTAGHAGKKFSYALDDGNLQIKKRLFFTATERFVDKSKRRRDEDATVISMDDERLYGPRAFSLSFREAADKGLITPYQLVVSVINGDAISTADLKTNVEGQDKDSPVLARTIATMAALEKAMGQFGLKKTITFHKTVQAASHFAHLKHRIDGATLEGYTRLHVSGKQKPAVRKHALDTYADADQKAIISNARCLTEGVNVPKTDMVAFIDAKKSTIDIVQAIGRALRTAPGKKFGYVFLPLHVNLRSGESPEDAIERSASDFDQIRDVLEALANSDEFLQEMLKTVFYREMSDKAPGSDSVSLDGLPVKVITEGFDQSVDVRVLVRSIESRLVSSALRLWDKGYACAREYHRRHGHCNAPHDFRVNGVRLGIWLKSQRNLRGQEKLSADRIQALDALGMVWSVFDEQERIYFETLREFRMEHGHAEVPVKYSHADVALGPWVGRQRVQYREGTLPIDKIAELEAIGVVWEPNDDKFDAWMDLLRAYAQKHVHCNVPGSYVENGSRLGHFVQNNRGYFRKGLLSAGRILALEELGIIWDVEEAQFQEKFSIAKTYYQSTGHLLPPRGVLVDNIKLDQWIGFQRKLKKQGKIKPERILALEEIGMVWEPYDVKFEAWLIPARSYFEKHGHCNPPKNHVENGAKLANWISNQRALKKAGSLSADRMKALEALGIRWEKIEKVDEADASADLGHSTQGHLQANRYPVT